MPPRDKGAAPIAKGLIRGRVVAADSGRPLRRARVTVAGAALPQARTASTNIDGRFEIQELPAGRFTVGVARAGYLGISYGQRFPSEPGQPIELSEGQTLTDVNVALPRAGVISGRVTDELGEPYAGVTLLTMQVRYFQGRRQLVPVGGGPQNATDDSGQYRVLRLSPGEYYVRASVRDTWESDDDRKETYGYLPTYYPGTANVSEAQRVKVAVGQEVHSVDLQMLPARAGRVAGSVLDSQGRPAVGERVSIGQNIVGPGLAMGFGLGGAVVNADGTFEIKAIPPGDYQVSVSAGLDSDKEVGAMPVTVAGDVEGLLLTTSPPLTVSGTIVDQNGVPPTFTADRLRISALTLDRDRSTTIGSAPSALAASNWTFELKRLTGRRLFRALGLPEGWALKAVMLNERDITDEPVEVAPRTFNGRLQIVITNGVTRLTGTVTNDRGEPVSAATVIAFAEDGTKWGDQSRFVQATRPDQVGQFKFIGLPPGSYRVVALEYVEEGEWFDPKFLDTLRGPSQTVKLAADETQTMKLKLARP